MVEYSKLEEEHHYQLNQQQQQQEKAAGDNGQGEAAKAEGGKDDEEPGKGDVNVGVREAPVPYVAGRGDQGVEICKEGGEGKLPPSLEQWGDGGKTPEATGEAESSDDNNQQQQTGTGVAAAAARSLSISSAAAASAAAGGDENDGTKSDDYSGPDCIVQPDHIESDDSSSSAAAAAAGAAGAWKALVQPSAAAGSYISEAHQYNCTYFSSMREDPRRYLTARAIQFFTPGVPQVYYVGLLAGKNDVERASETGSVRDINRHSYSLEEAEEAVQQPVVQALLKLCRFRNQHPAFAGRFKLDVDTEAHVLHASWVNGRHLAQLWVDIKQLKTEIRHTPYEEAPSAAAAAADADAAGAADAVAAATAAGNGSGGGDGDGVDVSGSSDGVAMEAAAERAAERRERQKQELEQQTRAAAAIVGSMDYMPEERVVMGSQVGWERVVEMAKASGTVHGVGEVGSRDVSEIGVVAERLYESRRATMERGGRGSGLWGDEEAHGGGNGYGVTESGMEPESGEGTGSEGDEWEMLTLKVWDD